jgi:hypothetical protein
MGGGDGQTAPFLIAVILGNTLDALYRFQGTVGMIQYGLAGGTDPGKVLAVSGEYFYPKFFFQLYDLLADSRLGGMQAAGGCGNTQVLPCHFLQITKLL